MNPKLEVQPIINYTNIKFIYSTNNRTGEDYISIMLLNNRGIELRTKQDTYEKPEPWKAKYISPLVNI